MHRHSALSSRKRERIAHKKLLKMCSSLYFLATNYINHQPWRFCIFYGDTYLPCPCPVHFMQLFPMQMKPKCLIPPFQIQQVLRRR